jgi:hypothetical protein
MGMLCFKYDIVAVYSTNVKVILQTGQCCSALYKGGNNAANFAMLQCTLQMGKLCLEMIVSSVDYKRVSTNEQKSSF